MNRIKIRKALLGLLILIIFTPTLLAQVNWGSEWKIFTNTYTYDEAYNPNQKLVSNFVRAVAVDDEGVAWIADRGTLRIFRDKSYATIKRSEYGNPGFINALKFDSKGNLWVGSSAGLYVYDMKSFKHLEVPEISNITEIQFDKNGHMYIAGIKGPSQKGGISIYDGSTWKNYNPDNSELYKEFVQDITFDPEGNLWMVSGIYNNGLMKFDGEKWTHFTKKNSELPSNFVRSIAFDSEGVAWIGTARGVVKYDGEVWEKYSLKEMFIGTQFGKLGNLVPESEIMSLVIDQEDVMWIGTKGDGIIRIQGNVRSIINTENSPITTNYINQIYVDEHNRKWFTTGTYPDRQIDLYSHKFGSSSQGFYGMFMYREPNYSHFENWHIVNTFTSVLPIDFYYEMKADKDGSMWVSGSPGVLKFNEDSWSIYSKPNKMVSLSSMTLGADGTVFAGAMSGLYELSSDSLIHHTEESYDYMSKRLIDVELDHSGNLWVANIKGADKCKDSKCQSFTKKTGIVSSNIYSIHTDSKGRVWICTNKGISLYDEGKWIHYTKKENGLEGYVYDVVEDKNGDFWAGTGKGLYKLEGDQWNRVNVTEGSPKYLTIKCMAFDHDGLLWIGTLTDRLYTYDGTNWKHYESNNSGIIFREVIDIEVRLNGDVWITNKKSSMSTPSTSPMDPNAAADPGIPIKKKIQGFDPKNNIVIFKK